MKKNFKYTLLLLITVAVFVLVHVLSPKQFNWIPTFSARDKNPFGAFVVDSLLHDVFPGQSVMNNNLTFYEFNDSIMTKLNFITLASSFTPGEEDSKMLLKVVNDGASAFLSANYFGGVLADTLGLRSRDVLARLKADQILRDTTYLHFVYGSKRKYYYRSSDITNYFADLDSIKADAFVIARNEYGDAVTLRIPWGKGEFIFNTTPLAFTNNYLLYSNHRFIAQTLSYLPEQPIWWTEYYQLGRMEPSSPLRVILGNEALSWALYLLLFALIVFIIFEAKRKQRIIPIVKPLPNTSLEFIHTIGAMYVQAGNHKAIAEKKIIYFLDHLRSTYFLPPESHDDFATILSRKTGNSQQDTEALLALVKLIQRSPSIPATMLLDLNNKIEKFNHTAAPISAT